MHVQILPSVDASKVESARYALIRRLGFVFRHHLVVNLQPLGMVCQVIRHRLGATPVDISTVHESVDQVERLVLTSIDACSDVVSWLTADAQSTITLDMAVRECLSNVRSSFSFRGFVIRYEETALDIPVSQVAVREVLTAALIAATDHAKGLSEMRVSVLVVADTAEIAIQTHPGVHASSAEQDAYRLLEWDDVQMLAMFHGLEFSHSSDGSLKIRIARPSPGADESAG